MYVDDCVEGLIRLMASDCRKPINLGTDRLVTVNQLFDIICAAAGKKLRIEHNVSRPQGVRGRNSDNTFLRKALAWEPQIPLEEGLRTTYLWIEQELQTKESLPSLEKVRGAR